MKLDTDYDWTQHTALIDITIRKQGVNQYDDRKELIQDTYVKLLSKEWEDDAPKALAYRIAKQLAIDFLRTRDNRSRLLNKYHDSVGVEYGGDIVSKWGTSEYDEVRGVQQPIAKGLDPEQLALVYDQVNSLLGKLPPAQAEAILLVDVVGYTYQEGADQAGISKQSFYRRHQRGAANIAKLRANDLG